MKKLRLLPLLVVVCAASVLAQSADDLLNDGKNTENVTTQSMGYARQSYSPLKQVNASTVKRLVPIWTTSLMNDQGELAAPTVYNGVMYVINGKWTFAIDVETGAQIWRTAVDVDPAVQRVATFGAITRGAPAIYDGRLFRIEAVTFGTNHVVGHSDWWLFPLRKILPDRIIQFLAERERSVAQPRQAARQEVQIDTP